MGVIQLLRVTCKSTSYTETAKSFIFMKLECNTGLPKQTCRIKQTLQHIIPVAMHANFVF